MMEEGLISLDTGLEKLVIEGEQVEPESIERYDFPRLDLFGNGYTLQAEYRPEVDFSTEDMEAVLSEKFVDMDEDWFTPTVAARRRSESNASTASTDHARTVRKPSMPAPIPSGNLTTSPIPPRQQAATAGSFASAGSFSRARQASISAVGAQSKGKDRWGALGEGLPFAGRSPSTSQLDGQVCCFLSGARNEANTQFRLLHRLILGLSSPLVTFPVILSNLLHLHHRLLPCSAVPLHNLFPARPSPHLQPVPPFRHPAHPHLSVVLHPSSLNPAVLSPMLSWQTCTADRLRHQ